MKTSSPPYLRPYPERLQVKEWLVVKNGLPMPLNELMPEWDVAADITLNINVEVDSQGIWEDCQLPSDAVLRLTATWESGGTGLRGCGSYVDFDVRQSSRNLLLEAHIEGSKLAGEVVVGVTLLLATSPTAKERVVPKLPGSLLWRNQRKITLEGTGTRFPVELVDFGKSFTWLPENAAWFLDWDRSDFTRPVLGSLRLYVNSNHKRLKGAVSGTHEADQTVREAVYFDVARTMIMTALDSDDFLESAEKYIDETVGAAVRRLIQTLFAEDTLREVAQYRQQHPERFECQLQDRLKLFWKE